MSVGSTQEHVVICEQGGSIDFFKLSNHSQLNCLINNSNKNN